VEVRAAGPSHSDRTCTRRQPPSPFLVSGPGGDRRPAAVWADFSSSSQILPGPTGGDGRCGPGRDGARDMCPPPCWRASGSPCCGPTAPSIAKVPTTVNAEILRSLAPCELGYRDSAGRGPRAVEMRAAWSGRSESDQLRVFWHLIAPGSPRRLPISLDHRSRGSVRGRGPPNAANGFRPRAPDEEVVYDGRPACRGRQPDRVHLELGRQQIPNLAASSCDAQ